MANDPLSRVIRDLRRQAFAGAGLSDGQLLECYVSRRDNAALEALVGRHGHMVWSVCRRILPSHHDAEDAYQATFLVLVRRAASVVPRDMVANWLHGVAQQTALSARATLAKRRTREIQAGQTLEPVAPSRGTDGDLWAILDREVSRLPAKYRAALIICDLEGKSRKAAALQLGVPEGTVASRLARAREMLAKRLTRRGIALSATAVASALAKEAGAYVPPVVAAATLEAVAAVGAGKTGGVVSAGVVALVEGVVKAMVTTKTLRVSAVVIALGAAVLGGGMLQQRMIAGQEHEGAGGTVPVLVAQNANDPAAQGSPKAEQKGLSDKYPETITKKEESQPWKIKAMDSLSITVFTGAPNPLISGAFRVQFDGTVRLAGNGSVKVTDLDLDEAEAAIKKHFEKSIKDVQVSVALEAQHEDAKGEVGKLRAEIADLRKEIKDLQNALRQGAGSKTTPKENEPRYKGKPQTFWLDRLNDADTKFRSEATRAVGSLAQLNRDLIPVLLKLYKNDLSEEVVSEAEKALIPFGKDIVPALIKTISDKSDPDLRARAILTLAHTGRHGKAAVPVLLDILNENDREMRHYAVDTLGMIGPDAISAMPALMKSLGEALNLKDERSSWLPRSIFNAITRIDPASKKALPEGFLESQQKIIDATRETPSRGVPSILFDLWQSGYEALKKKYEKSK